MSRTGSADVVVLGSDHNGVALKSEIAAYLRESGRLVVDVGPTDEDGKVDYTRYARSVALAVVGEPRSAGILVCGTGVGMSIAANKVPGARAALVVDTFVAEKTREHNDSNVLCLGAWRMSPSYAIEIVVTWLGTPWAAGRHEPRVAALGYAGRPIVLVPGIFDVVHPGHHALLKFAASLGHVVVGLLSDAGADRLKRRPPIFPYAMRKATIEALFGVDEVRELHGPAGQLAESVGASIVVKGANYDEAFVRENDGLHEDIAVRLCPIDPRWSTDELMGGWQRA